MNFNQKFPQKIYFEICACLCCSLVAIFILVRPFSGAGAFLHKFVGKSENFALSGLSLQVDSRSTMADSPCKMRKSLQDRLSVNSLAGFHLWYILPFFHFWLARTAILFNFCEFPFDWMFTRSFPIFSEGGWIHPGTLQPLPRVSERHLCWPPHNSNSSSSSSSSRSTSRNSTTTTIIFTIFTIRTKNSTIRPSSRSSHHHYPI